MPPQTVSLAQLDMNDEGPIALIEAAAAAGFRAVGLPLRSGAPAAVPGKSSAAPSSSARFAPPAGRPVSASSTWRPWRSTTNRPRRPARDIRDGGRTGRQPRLLPRLRARPRPRRPSRTRSTPRRGARRVRPSRGDRVHGFPLHRQPRCRRRHPRRDRRPERPHRARCAPRPAHRRDGRRSRRSAPRPRLASPDLRRPGRDPAPRRAALAEEARGARLLPVAPPPPSPRSERAAPYKPSTSRSVRRRRPCHRDKPSPPSSDVARNRQHWFRSG